MNTGIRVIVDPNFKPLPPGTKLIMCPFPGRHHTIRATLVKPKRPGNPGKKSAPPSSPKPRTKSKPRAK